MKNTLKKIKIGKFEIVTAIEIAALVCIATLLFSGSAGVVSAHSYYREQSRMADGPLTITGFGGIVTMYPALWSVDWYDTAVTYDTMIQVADLSNQNNLQVGLFINDKTGAYYGSDKFYIKIMGRDNDNTFSQTIQVSNFYYQPQQFVLQQNGDTWDVYQYKNDYWQVIYSHTYEYYWSGFLANCFTEGQHQLRSTGTISTWNSLAVALDHEWTPYNPDMIYPDYNWNAIMAYGYGYTTVFR